MQDAGCRMQDAGCRMLDTGYWILDTGLQRTTAHCQLLLDTGRWGLGLEFTGRHLGNGYIGDRISNTLRPPPGGILYPDIYFDGLALCHRLAGDDSQYFPSRPDMDSRRRSTLHHGRHFLRLASATLQPRYLASLCAGRQREPLFRGFLLRPAGSLMVSSHQRAVSSP